MHPTLSLASAILLAGGALAQYGAAGGAGMSSSVMTDMAMSSSMPAQGMAASSTMAMGAAAPSGGVGGMVTMHVVKVSNKNGDLAFTPKDMKAKVGDMVQFQFYPNNHSVVQAAFDTPCMPMKDTMGMKGLFSGYMPVKATDATMPAYTIMVNDTKPIWYYCSKSDHCQSGMVGVINAPAANQSRTIDAFAALAKKATANLAPSEGTTGGTTGSSTGNSSTGMTTMGTMASSNASMGMPSSTAAATQAKSAAYSSRYASKQDVLTGVGLATAVGFAVAFVL